MISEMIRLAYSCVLKYKLQGFYVESILLQLGVDWVNGKNWKVNKGKNMMEIVKQLNSHTDHMSHSNHISITLDKKRSRATLEIDNIPVYDFEAEENGDNDLKIRENHILTVWSMRGDMRERNNLLQ
jgi:hypothetical protein